MVRVVLSEIPPGAVLARAVLDASGRALLDSGSPLTPNVIACLERWGIAAVDVTSDGDVDAPTHVPLRDYWERIFAPHNECEELTVVRRALETWERRRLDEITSRGTVL